MRACLAIAVLAAFLVQPAAAAPAFKHVVIVFQENRTPDNLFGSNPSFEPGVDIASSGVNSLGQTIKLGPVALANCYDISHRHDAFEAMLTQGADQEMVYPARGCILPANPQFKYVENTQGIVQPYFDIARNYSFANRMFQTNQGPSFPAHQFIFGGTSAPITDTTLFSAENMSVGDMAAGCVSSPGPYGQRVALINAQGSETTPAAIYPCFDHATLTDLLEAAHPKLSWRYYAPAAGSIWTAPDAISHICQAHNIGTARRCTGPDWLANVVPNNSAQILSDIANCRLPSVSWAIPTGANSDHGGVNDGTGPQWVAQIVNLIGHQSCNGERYWDDTAIIITWDDWGGWYDHVQPFSIVSPPDWGAGYTYGFRVPMMVVSAYTPAGFVDNTISDFGTILYFIEHNFGLGFIGPNTGIYTNYADYHAAARGDMSEYFGLSAPRGFIAIPTTKQPDFFLNATTAPTAPDND